MQHRGRRSFVAELIAPPGGGLFLDYYVAAEIGNSTDAFRVTSPLEAPDRFYTVTLLND